MTPKTFKMSPLGLIVLILLSLCRMYCMAAGVRVDLSKVSGVAKYGDSLFTAYYQDLLDKMDDLEEEICNADKHWTQMNEMINNIESNIELRMSDLETSLEKVILQLKSEIRDQFSVYLKELMTGPSLPKEKDNRANAETSYTSEDIPARMSGLPSTMKSLNGKIINKLENEGLTLRTTNSHLNNKMSKLSQRADICVQAVIEDRTDNCTLGEASYLQEAPQSAWITILRRLHGRVDFNRTWADYKSGFGDLGGEFWLGLDDIHQLTAIRFYRLRVALTDYSGEVKFAEYSQFYIRGEADNYRLHVEGFASGSTAGDGMKGHNAMSFSTFDSDNDKHRAINCALRLTGGWWFKKCYNRGTHVNPTGSYLPAGSTGITGIKWFPAYNDTRSFKRLEMSINVRNANISDVN